MTTIETPLKYSKTHEYVKSPITQCPGCAYGLAARYLYWALGDNVITTGVPGCGFPRGVGSDGILIHSMSSLFGNAGSFAAGLSSALEAQGDTETVVVPIIGDGGTFDIGLGAISAAAERNDNMLFICKDNEGYQNTGNQRSSASPWMSTNTTQPPGFAKAEYKKDIDDIMAVHRIPYLATVTVAFPDDFIRKVKKAMSVKGFRFVHIFSPCPTGWGYATELTMEISRLAVETKLFPLFEVEHGVKYTLNHDPKGTPLTEYLKLQRRFSDISTDGLSDFKKNIEEKWQRLQFLAKYK
ncbi:thiamine pyrophosphate-dependent enzyme [Chloroflexota bacterium]